MSAQRPAPHRPRTKIAGIDSMQSFSVRLPGRIPEISTRSGRRRTGAKVAHSNSCPDEPYGESDEGHRVQHFNLLDLTHERNRQADKDPKYGEGEGHEPSQ